HAEGGVAGPYRVVFQSERSPEEAHDPVAHDLVHRALVAVDGFHHHLKYGIEQLAGILGIAAGQQLHGVLHVREQDAHLLALTLERALRCQDPLDEVFRRVVFWRDEPWLGSLRRLPALIAEPDARGEARLARLADGGEGRAAL